jgi:hypothetical protein
MRRGLPLLLLAGAAVSGLIVFLFDPARHGFYPICYLHAVTGLYCPGCGSTRAIHELLHGDVAEAARLNLLLLLCLPSSVWWTLRHTGAWLLGKPLEFSIRPLWLWTFLGVAGVFTVLRNLPGFAWLAP